MGIFKHRTGPTVLTLVKHGLPAEIFSNIWEIKWGNTEKTQKSCHCKKNAQNLKRIVPISKKSVNIFLPAASTKKISQRTSFGKR